MKIRVKCFLTLRKAMGGQASLEIEAEKPTIRDVLAELGRRFGEDFTNMIFEHETGAETRNTKILINGRHYRHLPDGLDNHLKDGDEVCIFPLMAGG